MEIGQVGIFESVTVRQISASAFGNSIGNFLQKKSDLF